MILGGYGIQILVNGNSPLREYSELYETSKEQITTKPSFIQDINTNKYYESDKTVFVAVPRPGMKFTIKLWADSATRKTYRVHAYIDGTWDNASYTLTDAHSTVIDYFIDEHDKKKYNFIFTSSMWTDDESKVNVKENNIHGFGSISVEFFEAEWTLKENENPSYTIVKDSNGSNGLSYHTQFEEAPLTEEERPLIKRVVNRNGVGAYYGWKSADKPSAVLTVHYRPKAWLKLRGLTSDPLYSRLSPDFTSESENSEYEYEKYSRIIYESEDEIEIGRRNLRRRSRTQKYIDFDEDSYHKRRSRVEERRITPDKTPGGIRSSTNNNYRTPVNNTKLTAIEKCNGKRVDNSRKDKNISNTSSVKFSSYFEEIIEETKFIDITVGSNKPTEEIRQNKKLREIIEILDSDDEV